MWLSRAEEIYLPSVIGSLDPDQYFYEQQFAMEGPPSGREGRPRGGVALICRLSSELSFRSIDCSDARLCGVIVVLDGYPVFSVTGCYMPYWDASGVNAEDYAAVTGKLDALISSLQPSAPTILLGDFNCQLCPLAREVRPSGWHHLHGFTQHSVAMQCLLDDHDLEVDEFNFAQSVDFSYSRAGCRSHTDHIAVPSSLMPHLLDCSILPPDQNNLSPHLQLVCQLVTPALLLLLPCWSRRDTSASSLWLCPYTPVSLRASIDQMFMYVHRSSFFCREHGGTPA